MAMRPDGFSFLVYLDEQTLKAEQITTPGKNKLGTNKEKIEITEQ